MTLPKTLFANRASRRLGRSIAMALALLSCTAIGVTALESPAYAKKKKSAKFSKGFVKAYTPINNLMSADPPNYEAARQQVPSLIGAVSNDAERNAAGGMVYNIGTKLNAPELQIQGLEMMIESGVQAEKIGQFNWASFQINRAAENWAASRQAAEGAIAAGYTAQGKLSDGSDTTIDAVNIREIVAQDYFDQEDFAGGIAYLNTHIGNLVAAGQTPPKSWISRGVSAAYNNDLGPEAVDFSILLVKNYPTVTNWRDAVNIQRNMFLYEDSVMLDLMRLGAELGAFSGERDYIDYADAADVVRRPSEVKRIIEEAVAKGQLNASDTFVRETLASANSRSRSEVADLPALESEARASGGAKLALISGDAYLANRNGAKAEEMYLLAQGRPGADMGALYTHLGIAQMLQGKAGDAAASFGKVTGNRSSVAKLWRAYAESKMSPAATPPAPAG